MSDAIRFPMTSDPGDAITFTATGGTHYGRNHVTAVLHQVAREGGGAFAAVAAELDRAYAKHGREPWSRHEFYAVLLEEVDELWDAIKADEPAERVHAEAAQVAAVVVRYLETGDRHGFGAGGSGAPGSRAGAAGDGQGG